ncbi:hypothetical protein ACQ5SO_09190 [Rhodovulum sp. DZ06]|uniref:hypothetical protein n=1 Tax=Rhodovulum sp. DZ06 TaxID=3425126 RepID=UPI003D334948
MRPGLILLVPALLLSACATPEYRAERDICEAKWLRLVPPDWRQRVVTRFRYERRQTGRMVCTTRGNRTYCEPVWENVRVPYTAVESFDAAKAERDAEIRACTARACLERYGNVACEGGS